jgi:hypothetical protein
MKDMMNQAVVLARAPLPMAKGLADRIQWLCPGSPSPLVVQLWITQTTNVIRQYQDLLTHLVEVQVEALDADHQRNQPVTDTGPASLNEPANEHVIE